MLAYLLQLSCPGSVIQLLRLLLGIDRRSAAFATDIPVDSTSFTASARNSGV